ncbi:MAG: peptide transporter [Armatimonadota bacterium]
MATARPQMREIEELKEYRDLMEDPDTYRDGFNWKTVVGALFIGFVMMPGSIYLGLVAGQTMGPAAEWTTIILFTEVARRSLTQLTRQEVYILYYIAAGLTAMTGGLALSGGPFAKLIWWQFLRKSAPGGLGEQVPNWVAPPEESAAIAGRTFLHSDWLPAVGVLLLTQIFSRIAWFTFGYVLFRLVSDGEKLPYPLAPITAQGATALAEATSKEETWRWRIFSVGSMIGITFGFIYVALPTITGVMLVQPVSILPIPWIDFTNGTEKFLPGAPTGIGTNLSLVFLGFVLPFWMVAGSAIAALTTFAINPLAQKAGYLPTWRPGMESTRTLWATQIDIWLSFGIGTAFAVAFIGMYKSYLQFMHARRSGETGGGLGFGKPKYDRGDFNVWFMLLLFFAASTGYVVLCRVLIPDFPLVFIVFFSYLWTPFQSYANARMKGLTGQNLAFPMIREATFILSGYKGVDIWFAPIPLSNYGATSQKFREVELTGTKFISVLKAELLTFPIIILCSFLFWSYIWKLNPIPSVQYPYAQKFWDFIALQQWVWFSSTAEGGHTEMFQRAIKPWLMVGGLGFGLGIYWLLNVVNAPVLLIYGFIRGLGHMPHFIFPELLGALVGRYYMRKRFGEQNWRDWPPVLYAGFSCGMGLVSMLSIAFALVSQSITLLPY